MRRPKLRPDIAQLQRGVRHPGHPEPCYMKLKQARGGPWVPALIWLPCPLIEPQPLELTPAPDDWCLPTERPRLLRAKIGDVEADPHEVWARGTRIDSREYHWRLRLRQWAVTHAPHEPEANPTRRVNLDALPSLF